MKILHDKFHRFYSSSSVVHFTKKKGRRMSGTASCFDLKVYGVIVSEKTTTPGMNV
jgi:hypothetical protein